MKIYTKTGDEGETGLFGGPRVGKDSTRIEAYGTVDELNAILGLARTEELPLENAVCDTAQILKRIQDELFVLGGDLASPAPSKYEVPRITSSMVNQLEVEIDAVEAALKPLKDFILPGGTRAAALLHLGRTICRRAERRSVALARTEDMNADALCYLNRLSDHLFVLARYLNAQAGCEDEKWQKPE
ncbi:MAG: cob(I)yrinic acid a,c-diamide adenosyltransferase [Pirellulales bacterium]|nr:cob(I)yrinic acid a,c-diamide adenosyltransferase [Pirellulales bacterium]